MAMQGLAEGAPEPTPEKGPWRITLDAPSFGPFMEHSRRPELREKLYRAYVTRASDQAEGDAVQYDNAPLIKEIGRGARGARDLDRQQARELFAALLFALTADDALDTYPAGSWQRGADGQRRLNPDWRIRYRSALDFTLAAPQLSYRVRALNQEEGN